MAQARRMTRPNRLRYTRLHRLARKRWIARRYQEWKGVTPAHGEVIRPLMSDHGLCRGMAARSLSWAAYERRLGNLQNARQAVANAKRERQNAEAAA